MKAFILAGGFATRLWPLTEKRAKPLLPLAGKPLLTHLVEKIPESVDVTVSTNAVFGEDFEKWKSAIRDGSTSLTTCPRSAIRILIEDAGHEDEKLGALGAVAKWITEQNIDDDVLLLAGDNYMGFSIEEFVSKYSDKPLVAAYDIGNLEQAKQFGVVVTKPVASGKPLDKLGRAWPVASKVTEFQEKPSTPKSTLVSTGCTIIPKNHLSTLVEYAKEHPDNIGGIFEHFLTQNIEIECAAFTDPWFDIGSFDAYLEATRALVGNSESQGNGNTFTGSVVIGTNSNVTNSKLQDTVLFENCTVEDCVLENCILDNNCCLRGIDLSGKMLREGTRLVKK